MEITNQEIELNLEPHIIPASQGKRFANYIIDLILFYVLCILFFAVAFILFPGFAELINTGDSVWGDLADRFISILIYGLYMGAVEAIFKGNSLGKLITKTRAVNLDGSTISTKTAFLRGLSRAVPFDAFSALGNPCNPWHDRWTDTVVADQNKSIGAVNA